MRRGKETERVRTKTVPTPGEPTRPIIGIRVDQEADIELPIDIEIDLGQVGGPSAGLAFGLEIARMLGRNVTKGCEIAATGELALDGPVLPVGGLKQKTIAARRQVWTSSSSRLGRTPPRRVGMRGISRSSLWTVINRRCVG